MRRHNLSLTVAVCVSLGVHAWAIHALIRGEIRSEKLDTGMMASQIKARPAIKRPVPVELVKLPKEMLPKEIEQDFGQSDGRGNAINSMQGDRPLRAKQAPLEQASLSRQPGERHEGQMVQPKEATPDTHGEAASGGNHGAAEKMLAALTPHEAASPQTVGISTQEEKTVEGQDIKRITAESAQGKSAENTAKSQQEVSKQMTPKEKSQEKQLARKAVEAAGNGGGEVAGQAGKSVPTQAGDPGEKSESESDAFSHVGAAVFQAGKLEARFGRKVKTVRPNFTLSSRMDMSNMFNASMQLEVHADSEGKPTQVEVLQSSGSNNVDEPVRLAMYRWWFEPPKDKHGKPMADVMVWTISFW